MTGVRMAGTQLMNCSQVVYVSLQSLLRHVVAMCFCSSVQTQQEGTIQKHSNRLSWQICRNYLLTKNKLHTQFK